MSSIHFSYDDLYNMVKHHIVLAERFSDDIGSHDFSLIFFKIKDGKTDKIANILETMLRKSDIVFNKDNDYIVLLPGTDWNGAYKVLSGIQNFLGIRIDETIVTFPDDGVTAMELLSLFSNKIEERYGILIHFQSPQT
jgi:hypothetical protein